MIEQLIQQGLQEHRAGRLSNAKVFYEQILKLPPRHPGALDLRGVAELQSGQPGRAAELIGQAVALQPRNWAIQANLANAPIELGRYREAHAAFQRASRLNSDEPQLQMGMVLIDLRRPHEALDAFDRALAPGRSARVLVPWPSEWRWLASGDASPWFPGFTIYRQGNQGDWSAALEQLKQVSSAVVM